MSVTLPATDQMISGGDPATPVVPTRVHAPPAWGAAVLVPLGAVLALVSTVFDPHSTEPEPRGMFVAYGADPAGADIAATILHYGFMALGLGLLLAGLAPASRRGRLTAVIGAALSGLGFVNMSGAVLSDWYDARLAASLGIDRAMELAQQAHDMPALSGGWMLPAILGLLAGPIVLLVGLARAGAVAWWVVALPVAAAALFLFGQDALAETGFLITLAVYVVLGVVVGRGLLRHRAA